MDGVAAAMAIMTEKAARNCLNMIISLFVTN
jgi:hypothetical protein